MDRPALAVTNEKQCVPNRLPVILPLDQKLEIYVEAPQLVCLPLLLLPFFFFNFFLLKTCQWDRAEENVAPRWEVPSSFDRRANFNKRRFRIFGCNSCPEASYQPFDTRLIFF